MSTLHNQAARSLGAEASARAYIDSVIEINRKYGMGGNVSEDMYDKAVAVAQESVRGLTHEDA